MLLASQQEIDSLADRIRAAYVRRGARWDESRSTSRVWSTAAAVLWQCRFEDPEVPVDPELFVASQTIDPETPDPWVELASPQARAAYRMQIHRIIQRLRTELERELQLADAALRNGKHLNDVVRNPNPKFSPLGRYILACRESRRDLADHWSREALEQHRSCPLYRSACVGLLTKEDYADVSERLQTLRPVIRAASAALSSLN